MASRKLNLSFSIIITSTALLIASCVNQQYTKEEGVKNSLCFESHCPVGAPSSNIVVDHNIYILSSNKTTKFADWVAYVVNKNNLHGPSRKRNWRRDPNIPSVYTLSPQDYKGANAACGYDRGHQAPLASFSKNPNWEKTNYLSNITPQMAALNQGPWVRLESAARRVAANEKALYVVTGPIYQHAMCALPKQPTLKVPSSYFKVIFEKDNGTVHYAAFIMPQNTTRRANMCGYAVNLKTVTNTTGLRFLNNGVSIDESLLKTLGC